MVIWPEKRYLECLSLVEDLDVAGGKIFGTELDRPL